MNLIQRINVYNDDRFDKEIDVNKLIDEFRFYSGHIVNFYNENMELIKSFPPKEIFYVNIKDIQPSQFYVDMDKVKAIESFIKSEEDICIPLAKINNRLISEDGHTRLYYAATKEYSRVRAYFTEPGSYTEEFAKEAIRGKME